MYYVSKRMEIAGAHRLNLLYDSKCKNLHGHNWIVTVYCKSKELNASGMIMDFTLIKKAIHDKLDHQYINEVLPNINPTAENMARWILEEVNRVIGDTWDRPVKMARCYKVTVQESEGNIATYEEDEDEGSGNF